MALRISVNGTNLDLFPSTVIALTRTNPVFEEGGSAALSVTLPLSPTNRKVLNFPERLESADIGTLHPCEVSDGPMRKSCQLKILSVATDGIAVSLGFDESDLYARWQDTSLRDIPGLPTSVSYGTLDQLITYMNQLYRHKSSDFAQSPFRVFPVAVEFEEPDEDVIGKLPNATIINEVYEDASSKETFDNQGYVLYSARRSVYVGDPSDDNPSYVTVPKGYGISPFLRVCKFLRLLFQCYDYDLETNVFDTDPQLRELCILNNTADTIVTGSIDYRDLLPDCTVNDFLQSLRAHFGAVFCVDSQSKTVRLSLIRDLLAQSQVCDLTPKQASRYSIQYNEPKRLVLQSNTGYTLTDTNADSYKDFLANYKNKLDVFRGFLYPTQSILYFYPFTGQFFKNQFQCKIQKFFSSIYYDWDTQEDYETEVISGSDKLVGMYSQPFLNVIQGDYSNSDAVKKTYFYALPVYDCGTRNAHTHIKDTMAALDDESLTRETELAFCFCLGDLRSIADDVPMGIYYGSPFPYQLDGSNFMDKDGNIFRYSLANVGTDGCYNRFWRDYDNMLRNSNRDVDLDIDLSLPDYSKMDLTELFHLNGVVMLMTDVNVNLPFGPHQVMSASFRTLTPRSPLLPMPVVEEVPRSLGTWYLISESCEQQVARLRTQAYQDWNNLFTFPPVSDNIVIEVLCTNLINTFAPPTAQQIADRETRSITYKVNIIYQLHARDQMKTLEKMNKNVEITEWYKATSY